MTARERGFLLLTSALGDPDRKPMSVAQFRTLADRAAQMEQPLENRELCPEDLLKLGYDRQTAERILCLLEGDAALQRYVSQGGQLDCIPVTRVSQAYPYAVRKRLGLDAPGCLWAKGDLDILSTQMVCLVGSRDLSPQNRIFAERAGYEAARQGITLVSGDARGADRAAQEACLASGGKVICVVADELYKHPIRRNVLYLSEDSYDLPFSAQRALSRNRVIHALGYLTLVAQCNAGAGGTWDGTVRNLRNGWNPVFCFDDGSAASLELQHLGATLLKTEQLSDMAALQPDIQKLI